jgi:hypothetical protein
LIVFRTIDRDQRASRLSGAAAPLLAEASGPHSSRHRFR